MARKPKPLTKLERLLIRSFLNEIGRIGIHNQHTTFLWARRTAKKIFKIKIREL